MIAGIILLGVYPQPILNALNPSSETAPATISASH